MNSQRTFVHNELFLTAIAWVLVTMAYMCWYGGTASDQRDWARVNQPLLAENQKTATAAYDWNCFWQLVKDPSSAKEFQKPLPTDIVGFANALYHYQAKDGQSPIADRLVATQDSFPGLSNRLGMSVLSDGSSGYLQPEFLANLHRLQTNGLSAVLPEVKNLPVQLLGNNKDKIIYYARMWQMIAGTSPISGAPEGKFADAVRIHFGLTADKRPTPFRTAAYCSKPYYSIGTFLGIEVFSNRTGPGYLSDQFQAERMRFLKGGPKAVSRIATIKPPTPMPHMPKLSWFLLISALIISVIVPVVAGVSEISGGRYDIPRGWLPIGEERFIKVVGFALGFPVLTIRGLPNALTLIGRQSRSSWRELRHPFRAERRVARRALRQIAKLPKDIQEDEIVLDEIASAQTILNAAVPVRAVTPSESERATNNELERMGIKLNHAISSLVNKRTKLQGLTEEEMAALKSLK